MIRHCAEKLRAWLLNRYLPWHLAMLAMLLCAPSLWLGLQLDDEFHRAALTQPELPQISRSWAELFVFIEGEEALNRLAVNMGFLPWWTHEGLRIAFFRPLTGLTHWVDYRIWPDFPWLMHLQSLLWLGEVIAAATFFYRRILRSAWIAGLAALLYAVDDAHGLPAVWLANRNALIGIFFGLLTLIAYDRWRRDGWWIGAVLAPLTLLLGLLAKESTLAIVAYLLAYAFFLDRGRWITRFCSLLPCVLVGALWLVVYKALNYGVAGSGWYIDPCADPVQFAKTIADRAPMLLAWQWLVPSNLEWAFSPQAANALWMAVMGVLLILALLMVPLLRRDARARFFAVGMVLSLLPACSAYPSARLLSFVGVGGIGLLAQFIALVVQKEERKPSRTGWRLPAVALCVVLLFVHLGMAPWALSRTAGSMKRFEQLFARAAASLPSDKSARFQTILIVNAPSFATYAYSVLSSLSPGKLYTRRSLMLGSSCRPVRIHRPDERTLIVRPEGGFLVRPGSPWNHREMEQLLFDERCGLQSLDRIYRDASPFTKGQRIELIGMTVEITAITEDGRPVEAAFRFLMRLENQFLRWIRWENGLFVPFLPPAVGETVTLPAATLES